MKMYETIAQLLKLCSEQDVPLWDMILKNEMELSEASEDVIWKRLDARLSVMRASAKKALELPQNTVGNMISGLASAQAGYANGDTICGHLVNRVMAMALSGSEVNASMGRICAAPTAGSCGILPAVLFGLQEEYGLSEETLRHGLMTASGLGAIIVRNATVSGAEGGCQAECGAAAAMASAAAVEMLGGSPAQCADAMALCLINCMGLICDPVAGLVQVPCAQRNASQAVNALLCADLVLGGMRSPISPDQVIDAMYRVGRMLPVELKETALGGIAATPDGMKMAEEIFGEER